MKRHSLRLTAFKLWGLALLALAGPAAAQVQLNTEAIAPPADIPLQVRDGAIDLSLEEAVELALRRNLGLVLQRYTRTRARLDVDETLGAYDLLAGITGRASDVTNPGATSFESSSTKQQSLNFSLDQLFPSGGLLSLGWTNSRSESAGDPVSPFYKSGLTFNLAQPLLRDRGAFATERQLLIAQNQSLVSNREFAEQVIVTLQLVVDTYWNLVESREQLRVAQESRALAQQLHERNRIQVDVGTMAPLELVQSEANIATNEEEIIRTQTLVGNAEDELRRLLTFPQGPMWEAAIRPTTTPEVEAPPIDVGASIRAALEARPEVQAQQLVIDLARREASYFRNQLLPSLDLTLNYGLGGSNVLDTGLIDPVTERPILSPSSYSSSLRQITGFDFDGWTAALTLSYPLQNRAARAASARADLDLASAETTLVQLEQQVTTEVRQAARQVNSAAKQIEAARASARFQERSLDAEKKKYENGMSSSFEITRIQQDLTAAKSREVTAIIAYSTALTQLQQATGQLLAKHNVVIDDPERPIRRWDFSLFGGRAQ
jgi:outer membrane protein TolC